MILSSYQSVTVSVNFAAFVVDGGEIIMDMAHNSNRVNSGGFSPLLWHEKQATSWGEPEAYCGADHCWLDERRIQVTFLIELFCVCFSTWHSLPSLARDNQWGWNSFLPFFPVQMSDIKEMNSACVCVCVFFWGGGSAPAFVQYMSIKGLIERREGPVVFLMVCVCLCVLLASRRGIKLRTKAWGSWISQGFHSLAIVTYKQLDCPTVHCVYMHVCIWSPGDGAYLCARCCHIRNVSMHFMSGIHTIWISLGVCACVSQTVPHKGLLSPTPKY